MKLKITTYQEEHIEEQVRIGTQVLANYKRHQQTPVDNLKQVYSNPFFEADTRFYAFLGDKMVGFLPSKRNLENDKPNEALLEFPIVLPGFHFDETQDLLMTTALEKMKSLGVE